MQFHHDEGVANRIDPESRAAARKGARCAASYATSWNTIRYSQILAVQRHPPQKI